MKKFFRLLLFGFLSWLLIFGASVCLFPLKKDSEHLFEILMGFVLTICTVAFTILYFRRIHARFLWEGCWLGWRSSRVIFFLICRCSPPGP